MRILTVTLVGFLLAASVQAASHRTFVAASGADIGTCGPTIPCRSLEYALSQTNSGGEIIITQSGGYGNASGGLVIDKSISIIAEPGVFAALAPTSGAGITIATAGIKVVLKGLTINGRGGDHGINMTDGVSLLVEKTTIAGFSSGYGMEVQAVATVEVLDSLIRDSLYGIVAGAGATVGITGSKVLNNPGHGVMVYSTGIQTGTSTTVNLNDTVISGSGYCIFNNEAGINIGEVNAARVTATQCSVGFNNSGGDRMTVSECTASNNGYGFMNSLSTLVVTKSIVSDNTVFGLFNSGTLTIGNSTVSNNTIGLYNYSGTTVSLGNNTISGNPNGDTVGTITQGALQ